VVSVVEGARDYEVSVDFDRDGRKKLLAGFAKLKKLN
jgi:DNA helicase-2/ATP-dependent DNA helicase PcrA